MQIRNPKVVPRMTNKTAFKPGDKVNQVIEGKRFRRPKRHHKPGIVVRVFGHCVIARFKNGVKGVYPSRLLIKASVRDASIRVAVSY